MFFSRTKAHAFEEKTGFEFSATVPASDRFAACFGVQFSKNLHPSGFKRPTNETFLKVKSCYILVCKSGVACIFGLGFC